jgi:hypothetical protein
VCARADVVARVISTSSAIVKIAAPMDVAHLVPSTGDTGAAVHPV